MFFFQTVALEIFHFFQNHTNHTKRRCKTTLFFGKRIGIQRPKMTNKKLVKKIGSILPFGIHLVCHSTKKSKLVSTSSTLFWTHFLQKIRPFPGGLGIHVLMDLVHAHASSNTLDGIAQMDGTDHCCWVWLSFFWKVWSLEVVGGGVVSLVYQLKSHNANVVETDRRPVEMVHQHQFSASIKMKREVHHG